MDMRLLMSWVLLSGSDRTPERMAISFCSMTAVDAHQALP